MGYLAYLIALLWTAFQHTTGMTLNQGVDLFLDRAVVINKFMFWVIIAGYIAFFLIFFTTAFGKKFSRESCAIGGCWLSIAICIPVFQVIVWWMSSQLAQSFGPNSVTDPIRFWFLIIITILIGFG